MPRSSCRAKGDELFGKFIKKKKKKNMKNVEWLKINVISVILNINDTLSQKCI